MIPHIGVKNVMVLKRKVNTTIVPKLISQFYDGIWEENGYDGEWSIPSQIWD